MIIHKKVKETWIDKFLPGRTIKIGNNFAKVLEFPRTCGGRITVLLETLDDNIESKYIIWKNGIKNNLSYYQTTEFYDEMESN